jgi:hypothetical protein
LGGAQVHDLNPGITQNGLFWTVALEPEDVQVNLTAGTATLEVHDIHVKDYFDLENALIGGGNNPRPAIVSFKVVWTATGAPININNPSQRFRGVFRLANAQIEWSGRSGDFEFQSRPLATSTTVAAEIGQESNGSFYS